MTAILPSLEQPLALNDPMDHICGAETIYELIHPRFFFLKKAAGLSKSHDDSTCSLRVVRFFGGNLVS